MAKQTRKLKKTMEVKAHVEIGKQLFGFRVVYSQKAVRLSQ